MNLTARILYTLAALLQFAGAVAHGSAFPKAAAAINAANLTPFFAGSFKGLWMADAATMLVFGIFLTAIALRFVAVNRAFNLLLAVIPLTVGAHIYFFVGPFYAAWLLFLTAGITAVAGFRTSPSRRTQSLSDCQRW